MEKDRIKYFIDALETNFIEIEFDVFEDQSDWPFETVIDIRSASLNGTMSLKLDSLPADWKNEIVEQIRKEIYTWETQ